MTPMLRADLHVHTCHSKVSGTMPFLGSRDCYSKPADVYRVAKARGMDLVAFTDHDSIGGALELLNDRPDLSDVIVGEEVSCRLPDGHIDVHLAVYGMTEALHRDLQPLRGNVFDAIARLREADVLFALNHLLHFYRGQIPLDRYLRLLDEVPALEVRNGTMLAAHNTLVERIAQGSGFRVQGSGFSFAMVAGSDAHTLRRVGTTWTTAPARTRDEFLLNVRRGLSRPGGLHGTTSTVAGDAYGVVGSYVAALAGFGPRDLGPAKRAACLAFAAVSLPFQFTPFVMAARSKAGEQRAVERLTASMEREPFRPSLAREDTERRPAQKEREPFRRASV
jgi:predicted metal-dependent phosphoesterase TrpH